MQVHGSEFLFPLEHEEPKARGELLLDPVHEDFLVGGLLFKVLDFNDGVQSACIATSWSHDRHGSLGHGQLVQDVENIVSHTPLARRTECREKRLNLIVFVCSGARLVSVQ